MADPGSEPNRGFGTRAIHAGQEPDPVTGAVMPPIYQTSTYVQDAVGEHRGYEYARTHNRTREALEACVAALEGVDHGVAFASGTAAIHAVASLLEEGDEIVAGENLYGGTHRLFERVLRRFGLGFRYVDARDPDRVADAVTDATRMVFVETPSNPLMRLVDLGAVGRVAAERELLFVVDNTFMTPLLQRPFGHGADLVVHSTTKFLNGHSDMVGGIVVADDDELAGRLRFLQNSIGAVPGPLDCWLALRGMKTLHVRVERAEENARRIARWLEGHGAVERVHYPGLESHPQKELADRQMLGYGAVLSLELSDGAAARRLLEGLELFQLAESLGGVESLCSHPGVMTHAAVPEEERERMGLADRLVRLSVGIEDVEDLLEDLQGALSGLGDATR
ncbi:MAG: PLP-dependent aspartate aminotransferase family protein [Gemmatimonadota bacterium]|nr:PLP-dependent aspartate aminotransferase family protein [Gemmatimonadota bacterium]